MCGIYGSINKNHSFNVVKNKLALLNNRGPDYSNIIEYGRVILGHTRLAIIDLDERSNQPFEYLHLKIVFNGEIYNYLKLKNELIIHGFSFSTTSDTEVICASYLYWGNDCVNKFNGMFSFVIYNSQSNLVFGARDRLGVKPFFYLFTNDSFEFCSQLSPLIINNSLKLSQKNISNYLLWGHQPDTETVFDNVFKLEPGTSFIYNINNNEFALKKYYTLKTNILNNDISFSEAKLAIKNLLVDSTRIRLLTSDVPVGVFLSGGVDSSVVTAIASSISSQKLNTYSIGFEEPHFDESKYAEKVSSVIGTNHTTIYCNYSEARDLVLNYENYIDEPFADPSTIPSLLLSKHTRKHVTVALTGDGGDEIFLGYKRYNWMFVINKIYKFPSFIRKFIFDFIQLFPESRIYIYSKVLQYENIDELYLYLMTSFKRDWFFCDMDSKNNKYYHFLLNSNNVNKYEKFSDFDIKYYLNDDINTKVDRSSMRFSLETRNPLMDYRIYDFVKSLPTSYKFNSSNQKILLKSILSDYISKDYFERPKSGFGIPLGIWFRNELKDFVAEFVQNGDLDFIECLNREKFYKLYSDHVNKNIDNSIELWRIIVLIKWLNKFHLK